MRSGSSKSCWPICAATCRRQRKRVVGSGACRCRTQCSLSCTRSYCTMSARRFTSDLCDAQAKGYIEKVPHFNSVLHYLEDASLFPILADLIEQASLPLRSVEQDFAIDST